MLISSKWCIFFRFSHQNPPFSHTCHTPVSLVLIWSPK
jgi:hypothetical protein